MRLLPPLFFIALSYPMIGLRPLGLHWAKALLVLVVSNVTSASLSMAIGAALHSVAMANLVGSLALLLSMLFAGFLLSRNKMPGWIGWAANLSYASPVPRQSWCPTLTSPGTTSSTPLASRWTAIGRTCGVCCCCAPSSSPRHIHCSSIGAGGRALGRGWVGNS
ncbi:hypothetical protein V8C86DRAFT_1579862 [Haematococcus lacustris]